MPTVYPNFPELLKKLMDRRQFEQTSRIDRSVFERLPSADEKAGGFYWEDTPEGYDNWYKWIDNGDFSHLHTYINERKEQYAFLFVPNVRVQELSPFTSDVLLNGRLTVHEPEIGEMQRWAETGPSNSYTRTNHETRRLRPHVGTKNQNLTDRKTWVKDRISALRRTIETYQSNEVPEELKEEMQDHELWLEQVNHGQIIPKTLLTCKE